MTDAALGALSNNMMSSAMLVYLLAMLAYATGLALRPATTDERRPHEGVGAPSVRARRAMRAATTSIATRSTTDECDRAEGLMRGGYVARVEGIAYALTVLAFLLHASATASRALAADRPPWGNMYEFATTGALAASAAFLVTQRYVNVRGLGLLIVGAIVLTLGLGLTVLYTPVGPLVPALNSYWLMIHVSAAILASGVFSVGAASSCLYLLRLRSDRRGAKSRLPALDVLDRTAQVTHTFAFPVWTFAVIAGAIWAEDAWGRYWGWDPKETWAFITWIIYAAYLHARATTSWRGRAAAWLAVAGFSALLFNFFGVNMWITGLHSYAGI